MLNLSRPPAQYDADDEGRTRRALETEDKKNLKTGQVLDKLLFRDTATGTIETVTVASGELVPSSGSLVLIGQAVASGGSTTSLTVSTISGSYKDLVIVVKGRSSRSGTVDTVTIRFNSDSAAHYAWNQMQVAGSTVTGSASSGLDTSFHIGAITADTVGTPYVGQVTMQVGGYADAAYKTFTAYSTALSATPATLLSQNSGGEWISTAAITSVTASLVNGPNFDDGATLTVYARG